MSQLGALFPDSIIEAGPATRKKYVEELQHSRFCLVIRCDYSYRSRLYDAVAAGCIPVLINDGWHLTVAPFADAGGMRYADFVVTLPESMFLAHPPSALSYIYTMSESRMRRMHAHLMKSRPSIVWGLAGAMEALGNNTRMMQGGNKLALRSVGALAWIAVASECSFL